MTWIIQWCIQQAQSILVPKGDKAELIINQPLFFPNSLFSVCTSVDSWSTRIRFYTNITEARRIKILIVADENVENYSGGVKVIMVGI